MKPLYRALLLVALAWVAREFVLLQDAVRFINKLPEDLSLAAKVTYGYGGWVVFYPTQLDTLPDTVPAKRRETWER